MTRERPSSDADLVPREGACLGAVRVGGFCVETGLFDKKNKPVLIEHLMFPPVMSY